MTRTIFHLFLLAYAAAAGAVELPAGIDRVPVWPELRIVTPADRNASPALAAQLAAGKDALRVDSPDRVLGRATRPYWAAFSLHSPSDTVQLRMLALESTTQHDVRLFARDEAGDWQHVDTVADASRGRFGSGTVNPLWTLRMEPGQTREFLLRVEGPSVVRFPMFAYEPVAYAERSRIIHASLGFALGSCLFVGLYVLYLGWHLGDRSVPLFLCMLIGDLIGGLWLSGSLSALVPALPESTISDIGFAGFGLLFGFGCIHARVYLNTAEWSGRADRLLQATGLAWLALAAWLAYVFPVAARILLVWGGTATGAALVVIGMLAARRKAAVSGFIVAAWVSNLLMGSYFAIARAVDNPNAWSPSSLALMQATAMAALFGLAMSQRLVGQRVSLAAARQEAVTQRERTAALMRERSLLFAATNHDLRQPLMGVGVFADLLKSAGSEAERREHARMLGLAVSEIDSLLVGIQQLASVHEQSAPPAFETVRLDDLLLPIVTEYRTRSYSKQITIRYVPTRLSISTHPPYFQRIVRNVLSNAIRCTSSGDRILIGCRRAGGTQLMIADTGRGMTEQQTRMAFEPLQRFETEGPVPDGFGLGLFSVRTLADALGLRVGLESQAGRGTVFRMCLSAAEGSPGAGGP